MYIHTNICMYVCKHIILYYPRLIYTQEPRNFSTTYCICLVLFKHWGIKTMNQKQDLYVITDIWSNEYTHPSPTKNRIPHYLVATTCDLICQKGLIHAVFKTHFSPPFDGYSNRLTVHVCITAKSKIVYFYSGLFIKVVWHPQVLG